MGYFSRSFVPMRRQCGFKTAYAFYHSNGGRRVFRFTYSRYLRIERGETLPTPVDLAALIRGLRHVAITERLGLARDFLRDLSGDPEVYDYVFAALSAPSEEVPSQKAVRNLLRRTTKHLSPSQFRAVVSSREATGCFVVLANVTGSFDAAEFAAMLGTSAEKCRTALSVLRKAGLVRALGKDRFMSRPDGLDWQLPEKNQFASDYEKFDRNLDGLARRQEDLFRGNLCLLRMTSPQSEVLINGFKAALEVALANAEMQAAPSPETPLYLVETEVRRFVSFPPGASVGAARRRVSPSAA